MTDKTVNKSKATGVPPASAETALHVPTVMDFCDSQQTFYKETYYFSQEWHSTAEMTKDCWEKTLALYTAINRHRR